MASTSHIYHRHFAPHSQDSLAILARLVRSGSRVLDLGCGPGVLGRYLHQDKQCTVDGVECNAAALAAAAADYQQLVCADLEVIELAAYFNSGIYDYIICADIIEHLREPAHLLRQLAPLLNQSGQVLLSVPNVAYAGLLGELLAGDFRYRPEGLLDHTHLRFYTHMALCRLLNDCGLAVTALDTTLMPIAHSEFSKTWDDYCAAFPVDILRVLLQRPTSLVYQFIVSAQPAHSTTQRLQTALPQTTLDAAISATAEYTVAARLSIAVVSYAPELELLAKNFQHLAAALRHAQQRGLLKTAHITVVDNGPGNTWRRRLEELLAAAQLAASWEVLSGQGNVGYAAAHNLALHRDSAAYHLILNPDVWMEEDALSIGLALFAAHPEAGLLAPAAVDAAGKRHFLCKRYPTILDLALRGFAPPQLRHWLRRRLYHYELREQEQDSVLWEPPIVSGCFMLARRDLLEQVAGFCADYFLYFEDFDLSIRLAKISKLAYVPQMRITHFGGHAARKGWRHIALFARSAARFFHRHGWRWW